jgi:hypothetical protein
MDYLKTSIKLAFGFGIIEKSYELWTAAVFCPDLSVDIAPQRTAIIHDSFIRDLFRVKTRISYRRSNFMINLRYFM